MNWLIENAGQIWQLTLIHAGLSVPPIIVGLVLSVPIGWLANRYRASRGTVLAIVGILYAVPSLPLFLVLPSIIGTKVLDPANVVISLSIYAVAIMVRTASDAFAAVDVDVLLAATAVGFSTWRRFWSVELPLAGPVLLSGIRVVSVSTISLVSVGSVIGVPSLGYFFLRGFQVGFPLEIGVGIVGTIVIAVVFDLILAGLGRVLMPWTHRRSRRTRVAIRDETPELVEAA
ncbi:ABC transporter permease [Humibacter sp. RRB41]|uniref:ABC transporter permease n=1 Tax=Humibacter sp. RRB41 TaxID=2919946 RepID=UPI001FA9EB46|nr:ABC transporter permease [Humibacter sp. RRB41]